MKARFIHRLMYLRAAGAALFLSSCAALLGPREVSIPASRLQEALASRFPFNNRYLDLFEVSVSNPRIVLQPETNRVQTSMDAALSPPFLGQTWSGSIAVSGQLKIDLPHNALVFAEPRIEKVSFNGQDLPYASQINKIGGLLAEQLFKDMPLYTFKPEDFRYAGTNFLPTKIATRADGLMVTFEPVR